MAKCINTVLKWIPQDVELVSNEYIDTNVKKGEGLLSVKLDFVMDTVLKIGNHFVQIKQSALNDSSKIDCNQAQDDILDALLKLLSETTAVIKIICDADLIPATKHRYFILYSCGIIDKLQRLLLICGRLSDIDQRVYAEDKRKLLVSEESITIHTLVTIWTAAIEIMFSFHGPAKKIFIDQQPKDREYDFIDELEFFTAAYQYAKIFLFDLLITSWFQFNRLIAYEDLVKGQPMLCPCQTRIYFNTMRLACKDACDKHPVPELLDLIVNSDARPSMWTQSVRSLGIVPFEPVFNRFSKSELSYFIIWHLYSTLRAKGDSSKQDNIKSCLGIMQSSFKSAMDQFLPKSQLPSGSRLSPHQRERFQLMFYMLNFWCETIREHSIKVTTMMITFYTSFWDEFKAHHDDPDLRINGLTIFQMFTKLVDDVLPIYTPDGQANLTTRGDLSDDEKDLKKAWDKLLVLTSPPEQPVTKSSATSNDNRQLE